MVDAATGPDAAPSPGGRTRARLALVLFAALLLATTLGFTSTRPGDEPEAASALAAVMGSEASQLNQITTTSAAAPTTLPPPTEPATTTTTEDPGPLPDPPPADPYAPTPQVILGTIEIPKLGVTETLQQGMTLTAINRGPGHWPGTAEPGHLGNMVIAGHRTTYSRPFADLDQLVAGDQVIVTTPEGTFTYEVRGVIIVSESHIGIAAQSDAHTATLFACHPKGSATHRIVAKLRLLNPDGTPADPDAALPPVEQGSDPTTDTTLVVRDHDAPALPRTDG